MSDGTIRAPSGELIDISTDGSGAQTIARERLRAEIAMRIYPVLITNVDQTFEENAIDAVEGADALIAELERTEGGR